MWGFQFLFLKKAFPFYRSRKIWISINHYIKHLAPNLYTIAFQAIWNVKTISVYLQLIVKFVALFMFYPSILSVHVYVYVSVRRCYHFPYEQDLLGFFLKKELKILMQCCM